MEKEEKLDILMNKIEERMQKITIKNLFHERKRLVFMKKFLLTPTTIDQKIDL